MIVGLFSMFDPSIYFFRIGWLSVVFPLVYFCFLRFNISLGFGVFSSFVVFLFVEVAQVVGVRKFFLHLVFGLFFFILLLNLGSLFPSIFPVTSHVSVVFPLGLSFWTFALLFGYSKFSFKIIKRLVPQGTPVFLMNFMVLVELISVFIRPITLSVRLVANITAGHLLMRILGSFLVRIGLEWRLGVVVVLMNLLEFGVAIIQSYVFVTLVSIYMSEV
jgi:F-type H+-transporting ATPase subunit a